MSGGRMNRAAFSVATGIHIHENGMTLREYAAIHLKVPNSGNPELDAMIEKSLWHDYAAAALQGVVIHPNIGDAWVKTACAEIADAMLEERAKRGGS